MSDNDSAIIRVDFEDEFVYIIKKRLCSPENRDPQEIAQSLYKNNNPMEFIALGKYLVDGKHYDRYYFIEIGGAQVLQIAEELLAILIKKFGNVIAKQNIANDKGDDLMNQFLNCPDYELGFQYDKDMLENTLVELNVYYESIQGSIDTDEATTKFMDNFCYNPQKVALAYLYLTFRPESQFSNDGSYEKVGKRVLDMFELVIKKFHDEHYQLLDHIKKLDQTERPELVYNESDSDESEVGNE